MRHLNGVVVLLLVVHCCGCGVGEGEVGFVAGTRKSRGEGMPSLCGEQKSQSSIAIISSSVAGFEKECWVDGGWLLFVKLFPA